MQGILKHDNETLKPYRIIETEEKVEILDNGFYNPKENNCVI